MKQQPHGKQKPRDANDVLREQGADALRDALDKAPRTKAQKPNGSQPENPDIYTVDSLRTETFPTLKQIAGDVIVEGLTLLASRPKIGKTWLALDVAIAVKNGTYDELKPMCNSITERGINATLETVPV